MARTKQTSHNPSAAAVAPPRPWLARAPLSPSSPRLTPLAQECVDREEEAIKEGLIIPPDDTPAGLRRADRHALAAKHEEAAKALRDHWLREQRRNKQVQQTVGLYARDTAALDEAVNRFVRDAAAAKEALDECA